MIREHRRERADSDSRSVSSRNVRCNAIHPSRRRLLLGAGASSMLLLQSQQPAWSITEEPPRVLCSDECISSLDSKERTKTPSGLEYIDIVTGKGPQPPIGVQAVVHYVAITPKGKVFFSSLDGAGRPLDIRVGTGSVVAGLDEGLKTMRVGGVRRLYIPGPLSFPNGLKAAAGRPSVPPASPIVMDVQLLYIPGLEDDE